MKAPVEVQFAQKLAANEPWVRDKAVKKLKKWFGAKQDAFEDEEVMKLWKGLYYCFWMSDKPLVQEELAENISSFVSCFQNTNSSLVFIRSFLKTFGREWFGIDRWRTDKFMMFTRRFLRYTFRFVAAKEWEKDLVEKVVEIFRRELVLCPIAETSLGFQLHFTDVFLEEIAKVGGEKLSPAVLEMFLDPYVEVVRAGEDARFRDHVVERIFNHLIRQSDPGIQWQMEEDGEEMEESMDEEEEEGEEDSAMVNGTVKNVGEVENGSDAGDDSDGDGDEGKEDAEMEDADEIVEDPRAGVGDAIIPQINVNYLQLSERLFELGSGNGIKKANRDALYKVSKMLKDVANDIFPLGPNLSDEDIDIPKINVKKSAKDLLKRNEEILKKNLEDKIRNKSLMSKMSEKAKEIDASVNKSESEDDDDESTGPEKNGIDHESSSDEDTNEAVQKEKKLSSKELRRKRKQEQKKRKREKALALEQEKAEKMKQAQKMIENDMERKAAMEPVKIGGVIEDKKEKIEQRTEKLKTIEKKKKKKGGQQNGFEVTNDSETVKELIKLAEDLEEKSDVSVKKKKKKKDKNITENCIVNASKESTDLVQSFKKSDGEESNENKSCVNVSEEGVDPTLSASKKKKKKKNEETSQVSKESADLVQSLKESEKEESNENISCLNASEEGTDPTLSASKKKKKKKKKKNEESSQTAPDSLVSPDTSAFFTPNTSMAAADDSVLVDPQSTDLTESKKKKKKNKLKRSATEAGLGIVESEEKKADLNQELLLKAQEENPKLEESLIKPPEETPTLSKKKLKKKKKEMHRIDSDIAFNAPSLSKINLMLGKSEDTKAEETLAVIPETEKSEPTTPILSAKKKKKMKKYNAETSLLNNEDSPKKSLVAPVFSSIEEKSDTPRSDKKKKKLSEVPAQSPVANQSGVAPKSSKVFEEDNSWDAPLLPGETEIVLPNKNYKGALKMPTAASAPEEGGLNGMVTPAKQSHTATFLKKALSKSVDGKKIKKEKKKAMLLNEKGSSSEPRKKKVNIVETRNKSQDIPSHLRSVKNSPQTPHDPSKNPTKGVLKKRVSLESGTRLNPVQLNTQLNGRSNVKKRKFAMDFF